MYHFEEKPGANYNFDYSAIAADLNEAIEKNSNDFIDIVRYFAPIDLFFLLYFVINRVDINEPWLVERCNEVQNDHNETLDIWARYHYKSTYGTFGTTIQDIIKNPEDSNVIFSHTRHIAKDFLREIKLELQNNKLYPMCWPDIFYDEPDRNSPKWSEDVGLLVKRKTSRKELTLEAWGLVDGMPTSKHYNNRIYDDLVTEKSVYTQEQIIKTKDSWEKSLSLKDRYGTERYMGTFYHFNDLYHHMKKLGTYKLRLFPAREGGEIDGDPVFLTDDELEKERKKMGPFNFVCQMLLNPVADDQKMFETNWLRYYREQPIALNKYILVDAADKKKKRSDYTVMAVVGLDYLKNYYLLDMVRDKLNLKERWEALASLVEKYPDTIKVGYEIYGKDAEVDYIKEKQREFNMFFRIETIGGNVPKIERIKFLQAPFANGQFFLPLVLNYRDINGKTHELIQELVQEEYNKLPFAVHDDMMDCLSRIKHPKFRIRFPKGPSKQQEITRKPKWNPLESNYRETDWMAV